MPFCRFYNTYKDNRSYRSVLEAVISLRPQLLQCGHPGLGGGSSGSSCGSCRGCSSSSSSISSSSIVTLSGSGPGLSAAAVPGLVLDLDDLRAAGAGGGDQGGHEAVPRPAAAILCIVTFVPNSGTVHSHSATTITGVRGAVVPDRGLSRGLLDCWWVSSAGVLIVLQWK